MAPQRGRPQWEDEDASTLGHDGDDEYDDSPTLERAPIHPIASMQGAFEESIMESLEEGTAAADKRKQQQQQKKEKNCNAKARRQRLLEEDEYNESYNAQWRKTPSAKYHPLWKLVAQISFGVHLLNQQLAKSDEEVSKILKMHVQEVDQFLEKTTEDFDLAIADVQERINYLKLPLEHVNIFDIMLDDRQFRTSIVEGNEKIEKIVERTARAMNDSLVDVEKGIEATEELSRYLQRIGCEWTDGDAELSGIYNAMCGNSEGWLECLQSLQSKGNSLGVALVQLGSILTEMSKRAGVASRRSIIAHRAPETDQRPGSRSASRSAPRSGSRSRVNSPPSSSRVSPAASRQDVRPPARPRQDKPLPQDPDPVVPAVQTLHRSQSRPPQKLHQVPIEQRFEHTRRPPPPPPRRTASDESVPTIPSRDKRRLQTPEPRYISSRSGTSTPASRSPATTAPHSPAMSSAASPARGCPIKASPMKNPSNLCKRLSVRGRDKAASPMVDSAYSSGSSGSSRSSDGERKATASPYSSPALPPNSLPPQLEQTHPKFGLFPQPRSTPPMTPQALSIRSGITGGSLSKISTMDSRPSTATTTATKSTTLSVSPETVKKRSSLTGIRNFFRRKPSTNPLGPTLESEAE